MRVSTQALIAICLFFVHAIARADEAAMALLEQTSNAARHLNYDGVFVYQTGHHVQSIRIIHKYSHNGEVERLLSLNGTAREMIRTDDVVTCIFPEGKRMNTNQRPLGRGFPTDLVRKLKDATQYYNVTLGKVGRVADRRTQQLIVTPVDEYRYGYRLSIDEESALLLESDLLTEKGEVIEKFAFSSVNIDIVIPEQALSPQMTGHEISWNRVENVDPKQIQPTETSWDTGWLPDGFKLVADEHRLVSNSQQLVEQRVYSDGLASVSVFIEKNMNKQRHLKGLSQMGAVNAYGTVIDNNFVTVVGQAPGKTIEKIGQNIHFSGSTDD